jgi:hypothetical protein
MVKMKNPITLKKRYRVGSASLAVFWDLRDSCARKLEQIGASSV